ncbi:TetR family transcriptional regulator [Nocardia sp. NPDC005998]|uniref:TetR family transcriptional regulator n=1 Tax=Nocardia sp. NPDC005998 TaxID=3156894 RepID=UPI0033B454C4
MAVADISGLRARAREALKESLAETAIELFDERGYDQVTVNDIAAAAEISTRSFFRYFPSKEDVVFGSRIPTAEEVRAAFVAKLGDADIWSALHATFREGATWMEQDAASWKRIMRVITHTGELRAKNLEKHLAWSAALSPEVARRLETHDGTADLEARAMVSAALGCFEVALSQWADSADGRPLPEIIDRVFAFIRIRPPHD